MLYVVDICNKHKATTIIVNIACIITLDIKPNLAVKTFGIDALLISVKLYFNSELFTGFEKKFVIL